jgi:hypothetical protein
MSAEPPHLTNEADPQRALIAGALSELRHANEINERESEVEGWAAWYDDVVGNVTSLEQLAGAMRVELARRHGELALAKGEQEGKNQPRSKELTSRPSEDFAPSLPRVRRYGARTIASHPNVVKKYIQETIRQDKVPGVRGVLKAIKTSNNGHRVRVGRQTDTSKNLAPIYAALERLAEGEWHELKTICQHITLPGMPANIGGLRAAHLIPWLKITRDGNRIKQEIDQELRAICEARAPRPELNGWSLRAWARNLRATITEKRKANHDERMKKRWQPEEVVLHRQTELLNWIENELDKLP